MIGALEILLYPDPRLKIIAEPVTVFDASLHSFLENMKSTMYAARGIGLAATQVADTRRIFVMDTSEDGSGYLELINPEIIFSEGKAPSKEGCLSIPDYRETISRKAHVKVRAQDREGKYFELEATELTSFCIQHELDHLNGILFVDHLRGLKKQLFLKWAKRQMEAVDDDNSKVL